MAVEAGITSLLFAPPSIVADRAGAGCWPTGPPLVELLYAEPAPPGVIVAEGTRS
jgi:hypothetical protein